MRIIRLFTACLVLVTGLPAVAHAQPVPTVEVSVPPAKLALAIRYIRAAGFSRRLRHDILKNATPSNPAWIDYLGIDDAALLTEVTSAALDVVMPEIERRAAMVYASHYTDAELNNLTAFWEGPTGQAIAARMMVGQAPDPADHAAAEAHYAREPARTALSKLDVINPKIAAAIDSAMPELAAELRRQACRRVACRGGVPTAARSSASPV